MESSPPPIQGQLNLRPPQIAQPARHLLTQAHRHSARLLMTMADPTERLPPHGAWLWRLRNSGDD
jgi:hypothetical protein